MKRNLLIAVFAIVLMGNTACSLFGGDNPPPTPEVTVFNVRASYVGLMTAAVQYESLPRCETTTVTLCSKTAVVTEIRRADLAAKAGLDSAENLVRTHGEVNVAFAVDAAKAAVDSFAAVLSLYKVKIGE